MANAIHRVSPLNLPWPWHPQHFLHSLSQSTVLKNALKWNTNAGVLYFYMRRVVEEFLPTVYAMPKPLVKSIDRNMATVRVLSFCDHTCPFGHSGTKHTQSLFFFLLYYNVIRMDLIIGKGVEFLPDLAHFHRKTAPKSPRIWSLMQENGWVDVGTGHFPFMGHNRLQAGMPTLFPAVQGNRD